LQADKNNPKGGGTGGPPPKVPLVAIYDFNGFITLLKASKGPRPFDEEIHTIIHKYVNFKNTHIKQPVDELIKRQCRIMKAKIATDDESLFSDDWICYLNVLTYVINNAWAPVNAEFYKKQLSDFLIKLQSRGRMFEKSDSDYIFSLTGIKVPESMIDYESFYNDFVVQKMIEDKIPINKQKIIKPKYFNSVLEREENKKASKDRLNFLENILKKWEKESKEEEEKRSQNISLELPIEEVQLLKEPLEEGEIPEESGYLTQEEKVIKSQKLDRLYETISKEYQKESSNKNVIEYSKFCPENTGKIICVPPNYLESFTMLLSLLEKHPNLAESDKGLLFNTVPASSIEIGIRPVINEAAHRAFQNKLDYVDTVLKRTDLTLEIFNFFQLEREKLNSTFISITEKKAEEISSFIIETPECEFKDFYWRKDNETIVLSIIRKLQASGFPVFEIEEKLNSKNYYYYKPPDTHQTWENQKVVAYMKENRQTFVYQSLRNCNKQLLTTMIKLYNISFKTDQDIFDISKYPEDFKILCQEKPTDQAIKEMINRKHKYINQLPELEKKLINLVGKYLKEDMVVEICKKELVDKIENVSHSTKLFLVDTLSQPTKDGFEIVYQYLKGEYIPREHYEEREVISTQLVLEKAKDLPEPILKGKQNKPPDFQVPLIYSMSCNEYPLLIEGLLRANLNKLSSDNFMKEVKFRKIQDSDPITVLRRIVNNPDFTLSQGFRDMFNNKEINFEKIREFTKNNKIESLKHLKQILSNKKIESKEPKPLDKKFKKEEKPEKKITGGKIKFTCTLCNKEFSHRKTIHMKKSHPNEVFGFSDEAIRNLYKENSPDIFKCNYCSYISIVPDAMHILQLHGKKDNTLSHFTIRKDLKECISCHGIKFTDINELAQHLEEDHFWCPKNQKCKFMCQNCKSYFTDKKDHECPKPNVFKEIIYKNHQIILKEDSPKESYASKVKSQPAKSDEKVQKVQCKHCEKEFNDQSKYNDHHSKEHKSLMPSYTLIQQQRAKCGICDKIFNSIEGANAHHASIHVNVLPNIKLEKKVSQQPVGSQRQGRGQNQPKQNFVGNQTAGRSNNNSFVENKNANPRGNNSRGNFRKQGNNQNFQNNQNRDRNVGNSRTVAVNGRDISVAFIQGKLGNPNLRFIYINGLSFERNLLERLLSNTNVKELRSNYVAPPFRGGVPQGTF